MALTLEAAQREINAEEFALAKVIREQANAGDDVASQIINAYEGAIKGNGMAHEAFVDLYGAWRERHAAVVTPIATKLGHDLPAAPIATSGIAVSGSETPLFFDGNTSSGDGVVVAPTEPIKTPPRQRWTQADVVALTKSIVSSPSLYSGVNAFAEANPGRTHQEAMAKAVELGLAGEQTIAPKTAFSAQEKQTIRESLDAMAATLHPRAKRDVLREASKHLREMLKGTT